MQVNLGSSYQTDLKYTIVVIIWGTAFLYSLLFVENIQTPKIQKGSVLTQNVLWDFPESYFWILLLLWAGQPTYFPPREHWVAGFSFLVCDNVGEQGLSHRLAIWWRKLKFLTPLQFSPPTASQIFSKPMEALQAQRWMCAFTEPSWSRPSSQLPALCCTRWLWSRGKRELPS